MVPSLIISVTTFILIILSITLFPNIKIFNKKFSTFWIIALIGAIILLLVGLVPIKLVAEKINAENSINPLKIIILFFSMSFLSIFLDKAGLFKYLAHQSLKIAKDNQIILFITIYFLTAILTIFTSNDIVILTFTPFICLFSKEAKINPIPYLVAEFASANTWSMMFIIGNPTNVYLGTTASLSFISYFKVMALPTIAAGVTELLILLLIFKNKLKTKLYHNLDDVVIEDKKEVIIGSLHLIICLILLVISSYIKLDMWLACLICAISLFVIILFKRLIERKRRKELFTLFLNLPLELIPFILSMFIIVVTMEYQGISEKISIILNKLPTIISYGSSSFLMANIINNIPMSILYSSITKNVVSGEYLRAIYSSIIGSNIGAFLSPIGALAGIMFMNLTKKYDVKFGFKEFISYGAIISIPTIGMALFILSLVI